MLSTWMLLSLLVVSSPASTDDPPPALKGGERILFFGDSITQAGHYVNYVEAFLLTRYPDKEFTIINHGISSETLSGLSEPDHDPPRPCALDRFTRDVSNWKPDIVVACFGMNDGIYQEFDEHRFAAFRRGVFTLIQRVRTEIPGRRLILMTPPPFDPYRRTVGDAQAKAFGYKYPAIDYDNVLTKYSEWLVTLAHDDLTVVDIHKPMNEQLHMLRTRLASAYFAEDGVHPSIQGHSAMAWLLLSRCWSDNREVTELELLAHFEQVGDLLPRLEKRNQARYDLWRERIKTPDTADDQDIPPADAAETNAIRELGQPKLLRIEISPLKD